MIEPAGSTHAVHLLCDGACGECVPIAAAALLSSCDVVRWCALLLLLLLLDLDKFDQRHEQSARERAHHVFHSVFGWTSGGVDICGGTTATRTGKGRVGPARGTGQNMGKKFRPLTSRREAHHGDHIAVGRAIERVWW